MLAVRSAKMGNTCASGEAKHEVKRRASKSGSGTKHVKVRMGAVKEAAITPASSSTALKKRLISKKKEQPKKQSFKSNFRRLE